MNSRDIERIQKIHGEIQNFKSCYEGEEIWGDRDGPVSADKLIAFLIENPHLQEIANNIQKLSRN